MLLHGLLLHAFKNWSFFLLTPLLMGLATKRVAVFPPAELKELKSLFDSLAELVPVVFEPFAPEASSRPDACIFLGGDHGAAQRLNIPCYVWESGATSLATDSACVSFSSCPQLHFAVRGQEINELCPRNLAALPVREGDHVMASASGVPVWTVRGLVHRVTVRPPSLGANERLHSHFSPKSWLGLLPLLHFLRSVTGDIDWQSAPPRACFLFDDPNLHAWTYGYLDFRQLAREAQTRKYHVAIATVPMDTWYVNPEVARLFREHSQYISLTTHGCQHTKNELLVNSQSRLPLLAQALRRVDKLEAGTQLEVSRVMVAPHSACSESTTDLMLSLGYEGATIAIRSLLKWNRGKRWPLNFGLGPVLWMGAGFPVIYRFEMRRYMQTQLHLTAFLGQPLVFYGHHGDCSTGMGNLARVAAALAKFDTQWGNLTRIMRSNYRTRMEGSLLHIQMASRRIELEVPQQATAISVERPWIRDDDLEHLAFRGGDHQGQTLLAGRVTHPVAVSPGSKITLSAVPKAQVDHKVLGRPPVRLWPMLRRMLTEARDRLQPLAATGAVEADSHEY